MPLKRTPQELEKRTQSSPQPGELGYSADEPARDAPTYEERHGTFVFPKTKTATKPKPTPTPAPAPAPTPVKAPTPSPKATDIDEPSEPIGEKPTPAEVEYIKTHPPETLTEIKKKDAAEAEAVKAGGETLKAYLKKHPPRKQPVRAKVPAPIITKAQEVAMWRETHTWPYVATLPDGSKIRGYELHEVHDRHPNLYRTLLRKGYGAYKEALLKDYVVTKDNRAISKEFIKHLAGDHPKAYDLLKTRGFGALEAEVRKINLKQWFLKQFKDKKTGKVDILKVVVEVEKHPNSYWRGDKGLFTEVGGINSKEWEDLKYVARYLIGKEKESPALKSAVEEINRAGRYRELTKTPQLPNLWEVEAYLPRSTRLRERLERQPRPRDIRIRGGGAGKPIIVRTGKPIIVRAGQKPLIRKGSGRQKTRGRDLGAGIVQEGRRRHIKLY